MKSFRRRNLNEIRLSVAPRFQFGPLNLSRNDNRRALRDKGNEKRKKKRRTSYFHHSFQYYMIIAVNHVREKFWLAPFASKQL